MSQLPESAFPERDAGPSLLSRVLIAFVLLTGGIGIALLVAAAQ